MPQSEPENLTILIRVPSEIEAAPLVAALELENIHVTMTGGFTAGFIAEAPGDVQIKVLESDLQRAKLAIEKFQSENSRIDWSQIDVGDREAS
jgi:hypothetical protein